MPKQPSISSFPTASSSIPSLAPKLPETGFLRQPQVLAFVPISKSTLWRRIQARSFPEPVKLSVREDVRRWIVEQGRGSTAESRNGCRPL